MIQLLSRTRDDIIRCMSDASATKITPSGNCLGSTDPQPFTPLTTTSSDEILSILLIHNIRTHRNRQSKWPPRDSMRLSTNSAQAKAGSPPCKTPEASTLIFQTSDCVAQNAEEPGRCCYYPRHTDALGQSLQGRLQGHSTRLPCLLVAEESP